MLKNMEGVTFHGDRMVSIYHLTSGTLGVRFPLSPILKFDFYNINVLHLSLSGVVSTGG